MIYTQEVQKMCPVAKGAKHEPAPIPEEGKWVHYSINPEGAERAEKMLAQLVTLDNSDKKKENSCGE